MRRLFVALSLLTTPALAEDGLVQMIYGGYPQCILARFDGEALLPVGYEEVPADIGPATYSIVGLEGDYGTLPGEAPTMGECGCVPTAQVPLPENTGLPELPLIATSTGSAALPLKLQNLALDNETYVKAAAEIMAANGVGDSPVHLMQVIRTDLEGDGVDEVFLVAGVAGGKTEGWTQGFDAVVGDYAFVALRRVVAGQVETTLLEKSFVADMNEPYSQVLFNIAGIADLTGDGLVEVIVDMQGHEFFGYRLYGWQDGSLAAVNDCGCGC